MILLILDDNLQKIDQYSQKWTGVNAGETGKG